MSVRVYWGHSRTRWGLVGCTRAILGPTGGLKGPTGAILGPDESYWDLLGSVEACWVLQGLSGPCWSTRALQGFTGTYWCIGVLLGPYWDLMGLSGTHWGLMGSAGFSWTLLMIPSGPYWSVAVPLSSPSPRLVHSGSSQHPSPTLACTGLSWYLVWRRAQWGSARGAGGRSRRVSLTVAWRRGRRPMSPGPGGPCAPSSSARSRACSCTGGAQVCYVCCGASGEGAHPRATG